MVDPVEAAIHSIEAAAVPVGSPTSVALDYHNVPLQMQQINVNLASGRPAIIAIPSDATDAELADLAGALLTQVIQQKRAEREKGPAARILVPR
jgi:hypothetical protein